MADKTNPKSLIYHIDAVKKKKRVFEDAFQGVTRMILDAGIQKITVKGKTTYQLDLFSQGKKHLVGMYDEINSFCFVCERCLRRGIIKGDGLRAGGRTRQWQNIFC